MRLCAFARADMVQAEFLELMRRAVPCGGVADAFDGILCLRVCVHGTEERHCRFLEVGFLCWRCERMLAVCRLRAAHGLCQPADRRAAFGRGRLKRMRKAVLLVRTAFCDQRSPAAFLAAIA